LAFFISFVLYICWVLNYNSHIDDMNNIIRYQQIVSSVQFEQATFLIAHDEELKYEIRLEIKNECL